MRNKDLDPKIGLPLKVITARLEHVKINLTGLIKRVEAYAIDRQKSDDLHECLISGDEWTYAALDCKDPIWRTRLKRTQSSLPHRQLRRSVASLWKDSKCSLPHRQLRRKGIEWIAAELGSLPHRQLRSRN